MARKPSATKDEIFVCIEGHATAHEDGTPAVFPRGARVRASSGFPQRHPQLWLPDASDDLDVARARHGVRYVAAGDVVHADDPFAVKYPDAFEPVDVGE